MANLGRYFVGDTVLLSVTTKTGNNGSGTATLPDAAPTAALYNGSSTIETITLPISNRYTTTAYFKKLFLIGSSHGAASYTVTYSWAISATPYSSGDTFTVYAGGDADGSVISAGAVEQPEANYILYETETGSLKSGRNPT